MRIDKQVQSHLRGVHTERVLPQNEMAAGRERRVLFVCVPCVVAVCAGGECVDSQQRVGVCGRFACVCVSIVWMILDRDARTMRARCTRLYEPRWPAGEPRARVAWRAVNEAGARGVELLLPIVFFSLVRNIVFLRDAPTPLSLQ